MAFGGSQPGGIWALGDQAARVHLEIWGQATGWWGGGQLEIWGQTSGGGVIGD